MIVGYKSKNIMKGKNPYIFKDGKYFLSKESESKPHKIEYLTSIQAKQINNLLYAKELIDSEIKKIKKEKPIAPKKPIDEKIMKSGLPPRVKSFFRHSSYIYISSIAKTFTYNDFIRMHRIGESTITEIRNYLISKGFKPIF